MEDLLKLAKSADDKGYSASAFEFYQRAISSNLGKDSAIYRAANNMLEIGKISEAEAFINKINRNAAPKSWYIEVFLGKINLAQFKPNEAENHFRLACKLDPISTSPCIYLADCLIRQEKFAEAQIILTEALKLKDDLEEVYLNLAFIKRATGDYYASRELIIEALAIEPDYSEAKRLLDDVNVWLDFLKNNP